MWNNSKVSGQLLIIIKLEGQSQIYPQNMYATSLSHTSCPWHTSGPYFVAVDLCVKCLFKS